MTSEEIGDTQLPEFMSGGGAMGALMRSHDWTTTPLGPPETWPQSLRSAVSICLGSSFPICIYWGRELALLYNDAWSPIPGNKHPGALGRPAREVWPEIWDTIGPLFERVVETGSATRSEDQLLPMRRHGYTEECYFDYTFSPIRDEAGRVGGIFNAVVETTYRVIGERRDRLLRELGERTATARSVDEACTLAAATLGTAPADIPFCLLYMLDHAIGEQRARLVAAAGVAPGEAAAPILIDAADEAAAWPLVRVVETGQTETVDGLSSRFDGPLAGGAWPEPTERALIIPLIVTGSVKPTGFLIAGVSPRRALDDEYRAFVERVAAQVSRFVANARTYEEERRRAEALAEIDRAKTAFFSNASHEFRTPLTLMLSPLKDMLVRQPEAQTVMAERSELELMHRNGIRLLKLVNTLLDFSRLEAGRVQAVYEPIDLAAYTTELASTFRSAMEKAGVQFTVDCPPLPGPVHVDRDMWEKIVLNLVSNAFKYTLEGEVVVALRPAADGHGVTLTVRDSGVGIPAQELPRVFDRFHRIEGQRGRTEEGTGIGLALVQELVRLHGGTVRAESTVGRGTRFMVSIPTGTAHLSPGQIRSERTRPATGITAEAFVEEALRWLPGDEAAAEPAFDGELSGTTTGVVSSERPIVLLADDNADMRDYLRRLLSERYAVEAVSDGQAALEAAQRRRPDLVLSDVMMPRLDGFGLLRALRGDDNLRDVPVILLSARAGEEASVEGLEAGADDYLIKPFSARELLARVRANLDLAALRREAVRVENELRLEAQIAQERAEAVLTSINDGFLTLDQDWRFTYVNAAAGRMLGRAGAELIGKDVWDEYPASLGSTLEIHYRRAMTERVNVAFEYYSTLQRRWFDIRAYPARDSGLSVYFQDITERKHAEDALRRLNETLEVQVVQRTAELQAKEARLRTIFETSYTYQGLMALDGTLLDANATSLAGIGATLDDVVGKSFWETPWFTGTPGMTETVRGAIPLVASGEIVRQEIRVNLPVGGWRWFDFQMRPVRDKQGAVVAIVPEAVEVTGRRQAEEALRQSQKMEALGQLTGGIAHDFNNMLTGITGSIDMIRRRLATGRTDALDRYMDAASTSAQRAAALTHRLLAFARRQSLDIKPQDVNALVAGLEDMLRRTLGEKITFETVLKPDVWPALTDTNQLESAILNLAINARDAMPDGGRLTIATANTHLDEAYTVSHDDANAGDYVVICVSDTGTGMSSDVVKKAFEPFFTTKPIGQGTGLGLSMIYGFIKQSGGHVRLHSEVGKGTKVELYLRRAAQETEQRSANPEAAAPRGLGETVLVVEDDATVRHLITDALHELGYRYVEASDAGTAIPHLESAQPIDLLITDVGLPNINGRQLAEIARQHRPDLKVLFITGYAENAAVRPGTLPAGMEIVTKPFAIDALAARIRDLLGDGSSRANNGHPTSATSSSRS